MPRFRQLLFAGFLVLFALLPRSVSAAPIPRYDLESLCYMSTDVVEATIVRHHIAELSEGDDRFTATVTSSIAGRYHPSDKVANLDLTLYNPNAAGQHCILFIARKQFQFYVLPSPAISPEVVDMLLIGSRSRVQRYYQYSNPGGLTTTASLQSPILAAERSAISAKWAAVDRLRPLLSRPLRREDIPVFQSLIQVRRSFSGPGLQNIICEIAKDRLDTLRALSR